MLEIEIDGQQLQVPEGSTIMDAALSTGKYIPHFCYHKKLSIAASCRMCLVQVEKMPKPVPACATPVTNGMKVQTASEFAVNAQKSVMEFLLINHPLDCPICDQGGECQLQDLSMGYGGDASRYREEKRVVLNKPLGPLIATSMTRCINCTRCVRFTAEIAGRMELGQANRGEHAEIMPFLQCTVDSELSGNVIDLCPVGALTSKPYRFSARTWELSRRRSVSPHDSLGSNLIVQTKHDVVKRVLPLENEEINECWLSDKDRFSYEALNGGARLLSPFIRQGAQWKQVDWETALSFVAGRLQNIIRGQGSDAFGTLVSPHATLEELFLAQKLTRALGSENIDFRLRQWDFRADGKRSGVPWLGMRIAEVASLDRLLVIGSFLRKDAPLLAQRVRQAAKKGLEVSRLGPAAEDWLIDTAHAVLVSPSAMVEKLGEVVVALASLKSSAVDEGLATRLPVEASAEAQAIAQSLANGQKSAVWLGNLAVQHARAAEIELLAQEIARLTGGVFGAIGEAANSVGGYLANAIPGENGLDARRMLEQPRRAYLVFGADPQLDMAVPSVARAAMETAELVVGFMAFESPELRAVADVLLPIAPFTETSGSFVNCEGRAQHFNAVARPAGECRPGWKVLRVLGNLLNMPGFEYADSEAVRQEALGDKALSRLDNGVTGIQFAATEEVQGIERVADVPIYFADPLVRNAPSLQKTKDAAEPVARMSEALMAQVGIVSGDRIRVGQAGRLIELVAEADEAVAPGCIWISAGHAATAFVGPMSGEISVERA